MTVRLRIFVGAAVSAVCYAPAQGANRDDPELLYRQREDVAAAKQAAVRPRPKTICGRRWPDADNRIALSVLADLLVATGRRGEARVLQRRLLDAPIDEEWAPEDQDYKGQASVRLNAFAPE